MGKRKNKRCKASKKMSFWIHGRRTTTMVVLSTIAGVLFYKGSEPYQLFASYLAIYLWIIAIIIHK